MLTIQGPCNRGTFFLVFVCDTQTHIDFLTVQYKTVLLTLLCSRLFHAVVCMYFVEWHCVQ